MANSSSHHPDPAAAFDPHAITIAKRQYFQAGDQSLEDMFRRVANWVARPEAETVRDEAAEQFYQLMISKRFCPGGRVLAGADTLHGNVLNCFVQDGGPEVAGTTDWVLNLATKLALVTKVGGGNGVNLDPLGPKRRFSGLVGRLYLTIDPQHADYEKVRTGTFLDLVRGEYVTRGYRSATFVERGTSNVSRVRVVGDSVDDIWGSAADMVKGLLAGQDVLVDLSDLRAEGTPVAGSGGTSSGPSSFAVEVFDNFAIWAGFGGAEFAGPVATLRYIFAPTLRAIRQGGCLHPDTLVNTSRGTLRLSELVDSHQQGWQDHHLKVATDQGWKVSPRGFNNGVSETLRVTLANGQTLRGTPNHKLKIMRPDGTRAWVPFEELQAGDNVIQVLDQHTGAPVTLRPVDLPHHNAKTIRMPEVLTERLAFFLGYLWGDGFVSTGRVGFSVAHGSPMMEEGPRLFKELFDLDVVSEQKEGDASVVFVTKSAQLIAWLEANGLVKAKARDLTLPKAVRMAPRPVVGSFLKGLFEADGSLSHGMPTLSTASVGLAEDVMTMLAGLGIPTKRRTTQGISDRYSRHAIHSVTVVSHKGLERFLERVGCIAGSRLAAAAEHVPDEQREQAWVLPHATAILAPVMAAMPAGAKGRPSEFTATRKNVSRYMRGERNLTASGYDRLHRDPNLEYELGEFGYDEYYVPVRSVTEAGRSLTLDLSVDENKTYLAGGFVTHNTRRGAGMATLSITHPDVKDFVTAKDLEREQTEGDISTFNISVLVTDEFMERAKNERHGQLYEIAQHAWATGEPGLIYVDRINEHNPMRAELGDIMSTNPCVTADTKVLTVEGPRSIGELAAVGQDVLVWSMDSRTGVMQQRTMRKPRMTRASAEIVTVAFDSGLELRCTLDHNLFTVDGEKVQAQQLQPGDSVLAYVGAPADRGVLAQEQVALGSASVVNHKVVSVTPAGREDVFNGTVDEYHTYLIPDADGSGGIVSANCGEIPLYPGEPCDLGALNLAAYVKERGRGLAGYDFEGFAADVATSVRFLDNVLDVNKFALEDNRDMSMKLRRLGLGVMGLADALILMGYGYDTDEGRDAVEGMIGALRNAAEEASRQLAEERGAFPLFDKSDLTTKRRNVAVLTVAPTGTTSMLMGVSSGVEPVFAPFIYRKIGTDYHALIHPLFQELLEEHQPHAEFYKDGGWDWEKVVAEVQANHGSVQGLAFIPEEVQRVLRCAHDIAPADHVKMQGAVQRAFDGGEKLANSISKTINLPNQATVDDVFESYSLAFSTGCKGITVYRDGSRDFQVLSTSAKKSDTKAEQSPAPAPAAASSPAPAAASVQPAAVNEPARQSGMIAVATTAQAATAQTNGRNEYLPGEPLFERPIRLSGFTDSVKLMLPTGEKRGFFVTVNKQDDLPTEVFIVSGKAGDEANADSEALGRVVSIALQYGVPAEALIKTLRGINGGMYGTYHGRLVASKADLLAVALETAGAENVLNKGRGCPDCGAPLRFEEGCEKCESCGYSRCG